MKKIVVLTLLLFASHAMADNPAGLRYLSKQYCNFTNPVEHIRNLRRSTCEQQHIIQRQSGGEDTTNAVYFSGSNHMRTDRWDDKPWENARPWLNLGFTGESRQSLEQAYMLGTYGPSWHFLIHSYNGNGGSAFTAVEFDGVSNFLYGYSWLINIPQRMINKMAYIASPKKYRQSGMDIVQHNRFYLIGDFVVAIVVVGFEALLAIVSTIVSTIVGTLFNPVDTLSALLGGLVLVAQTSLIAVFGYLKGVFNILTGGWLGILLLPLSIIGSFLPIVVSAKIVDAFKR